MLVALRRFYGNLQRHSWSFNQSFDTQPRAQSIPALNSHGDAKRAAPQKQCTEDLRGGEESDDSSVVFTGSAPAPPAPPAPTKSIKVMKEAIRAAGLGTSDLLERSHVEERYEQALARLEEADRRAKAPSAAPAASSNGGSTTRSAWHPLRTRAIGGADSPGNRGALSHADVMAGDPLAAVISNFQINAFRSGIAAPYSASTASSSSTAARGRRATCGPASLAPRSTT